MIDLTHKILLGKSKNMELIFFKIDRINIGYKQRLPKSIKILKKTKINTKIHVESYHPHNLYI